MENNEEVEQTQKTKDNDEWAYNSKLNRLKRDYDIALSKEQLEGLQQERKDQQFYKFRSQVDFTLHTGLLAFVVWASLMTMRYYGVI